jgi:hypothetical protein
MVKVGNEGDVGSVEIVEMLLTVKGPTAGAILMQWNIKEDAQGSGMTFNHCTSLKPTVGTLLSLCLRLTMIHFVAGMWDTHFRVGGAHGSDLDVANCPKLGYSEKCIAASLLFHLTEKSSGYFENVWVWTGDHDNDMRLSEMWDSAENQISVYTGRGVLIESQGPCWFIGSGSEHSSLYQYQLYKAKNVSIRARPSDPIQTQISSQHQAED